MNTRQEYLNDALHFNLLIECNATAVSRLLHYRTQTDLFSPSLSVTPATAPRPQPPSPFRVSPVNHEKRFFPCHSPETRAAFFLDAIQRAPHAMPHASSSAPPHSAITIMRAPSSCTTFLPNRLHPQIQPSQQPSCARSSTNAPRTIVALPCGFSKLDARPGTGQAGRANCRPLAPAKRCADSMNPGKWCSVAREAREMRRAFLVWPRLFASCWTGRRGRPVCVDCGTLREKMLCEALLPKRKNLHWCCTEDTVLFSYRCSVLSLRDGS